MHADARCTGVSRIFRLREVIPTGEKDKRSARTFNIPLRHNSVSSPVHTYHERKLTPLDVIAHHYARILSRSV